MKEICFLGDTLDCIRDFPSVIKQRVGYELHRVQSGLMPTDFKMMKTIGHGVVEVRLRDDSGAFRVIYTAKVGNCIYVLHAFQKKTQATSAKDLAIAQQRLKEIL